MIHYGWSHNGTWSAPDGDARLAFASAPSLFKLYVVQEVIRAQEMRTVPLAPNEVKGLINLRGQIVTAIDLRHMLGLPARHEEDGPSMNVVVRYDDEAISVLVDEAGDVVELTEEDFEPVPPTVTPRLRRLLSGAFKLDGSLVLVLDVEATVKDKPGKDSSRANGRRSA